MNEIEKNVPIEETAPAPVPVEKAAPAPAVDPEKAVKALEDAAQNTTFEDVKLTSLAEEAAASGAVPVPEGAAISRRAAEKERRAEAQRRADARMQAEAQAAERVARITLLGSLRTAIKQHTRYPGKIYTSFEKDGVAYAAVLIPGDVTVLVPFEQMFRENPLDMSRANPNTESGKRDILQRELQVLRRMNEAVIPIVVSFADYIKNEETGESELKVIGSRKIAMEAITRINFPANPTSRSINAGDIVEGTVISVAIHAMRVNVAGVDVKIPKFIATNAYVNDMTEVYRPNDKIALYIEDIKRLDDGGVDLKVDGRVAERVKNRDRLNLIPNGSEVIGTISSTRRDKNNKEFTIMYAYIDSIGVPCIVKHMSTRSIGRDIKIGDRVRMVVVDRTNTGFLCTVVREFLGSSTFDGR